MTIVANGNRRILSVNVSARITRSRFVGHLFQRDVSRESILRASVEAVFGVAIASAIIIVQIVSDNT